MIRRLHRLRRFLSVIKIEPRLKLPVSTAESGEFWRVKVRRGRRNPYFCGIRLVFSESSNYLVQDESVPHNADSIQPSVRCFRSKSDRRILEMKTKVICGRSSVMGAGKTKSRISSRDGNRGVVLNPTGRASSLILVALQLIARKIRAKE
jgi:hypothetical protein